MATLARADALPLPLAPLAPFAAGNDGRFDAAVRRALADARLTAALARAFGFGACGADPVRVLRGLGYPGVTRTVLRDVGGMDRMHVLSLNADELLVYCAREVVAFDCEDDDEDDDDADGYHCAFEDRLLYVAYVQVDRQEAALRVVREAARAEGGGVCGSGGGLSALDGWAALQDVLGSMACRPDLAGLRWEGGGGCPAAEGWTAGGLGEAMLDGFWFLGGRWEELEEARRRQRRSAAAAS
jgi:hypothetical protein